MFYLQHSSTFEELIKKSRFIGIILPCETEQEVWHELKQAQIQHPHASHVAFAYRFKINSQIMYRFHDAGEPTGTAGKPIFQHLEGKNLINVLLIVIRYFGGVKLGAGGLTRAYGNTAKRVIDSALLLPYIETVTLPFTIDYDQFQPFEYALKKARGQIIEQIFEQQIQLMVRLPVEKMELFRYSWIK